MKFPCNYFGLYSSRLSSAPSYMNIDSINDPRKLEYISNHSISKNEPFHPLTDRPDPILLKSLPYHHGILKLHNKNNKIVDIFELEDNMPIEFTFQGMNVNLNRGNNYGLSTNDKIKTILLRIRKEKESYFGYIEIISNEFRSFYYVFTPNLLYNYNTGSICNHIPSKSNQLLEKIKKDLSVLDSKVHDLEFYESTQSYTINKQKIYLRLSDKEGKSYNYDSLLFVAIHELSHALVKDVGHTPLFIKKMEELLQKALEKNIIQKIQDPPDNYNMIIHC